MTSVTAFKEKLDQEHEWPGIYIFKFVVPKEKVQDFKETFPEYTFQERKSKAGNYISFTLKMEMKSSDEVVDIYFKAKTVEGIISL